MLSHRMSSTPEYVAWKGMKQRCEYPKHVSYSRYGGRGITVCERWQKFENFYVDMGDKPNGAQLERIDNDDGYKPGNVVWATRKQQANNTINNHFVTHNGLTKTISQWAEDLGEHQRNIVMRLRRDYTHAQALGFEEPPERHSDKQEAQHKIRKTGGVTPTVTVLWNGKERLLSEVAKETNIPYDVALRRRGLGWPVERIFSRKVEPAHGNLLAHPITGEMKYKAELAREFGITRGLLQSRLNSGWTLKQALLTNDGRRDRHLPE